ncbi:hypothetical protein GMMP1_660023 [Candidatus Magnetomoraceae bacterium gMMP-1]
MITNKYSVSVIIPTYNRSNLICDAVDSALSQKVSNNIQYEVIVVDDCSQDNTLEVLKYKYGNTIKLIQQPKNQGESATRNVGIKAAETEFVCFLDSDDVFLPDAISCRLKVFIDNPEFNGVVYAGSYYGDELMYPLEDLPRGNVLIPYLYKPFLNVSCFMVRKQLIFDSGLFNETLTIMPDVLLLMKLMARVKFFAVPNVISKIRKQKDSISCNYEKVVIQGTHFLKLIQADPLLMKKLSNNFLLIEARVYRSFLGSLYKTSRYKKFCHYWKYVRKQKLEGFNSRTWFSRWIKSRIFGAFSYHTRQRVKSILHIT